MDIGAFFYKSGIGISAGKVFSRVVCWGRKKIFALISVGIVCSFSRMADVGVKKCCSLMERLIAKEQNKSSSVQGFVEQLRDEVAKKKIKDLLHLSSMEDAAYVLKTLIPFNDDEFSDYEMPDFISVEEESKYILYDSDDVIDSLRSFPDEIEAIFNRYDLGKSSLKLLCEEAQCLYRYLRMAAPHVAPYGFTMLSSGGEKDRERLIISKPKPCSIISAFSLEKSFLLLLGLSSLPGVMAAPYRQENATAVDVLPASLPLGSTELPFSSLGKETSTHHPFVEIEHRPTIEELRKSKTLKCPAGDIYFSRDQIGDGIEQCPDGADENVLRLCHGRGLMPVACGADSDGNITSGEYKVYHGRWVFHARHNEQYPNRRCVYKEKILDGILDCFNGWDVSTQKPVHKAISRSAA
ncbi:hypothetical protein GCM10023116_26720 [Kistimonas scapharcae]|uniref:Uncharacterized protein n=1 Tax=Kistimonas scapharcae TaxID=1036133 RepID=A0ABP8V4B3_9GAMM